MPKWRGKPVPLQEIACALATAPFTTPSLLVFRRTAATFKVPMTAASPTSGASTQPEGLRFHMLIHLGYDIIFDAPAPVATVALLKVHPSRAQDLRMPDELK